VMMGEKVFPTHLAALLISGRINTSAFDMPSARKGLSQREVQIVRCLLNGDSNKVVANHLNITEATVKVHLKSLLRKINATNRTQAAIWALNNGFANEPAQQQAPTQQPQPTKQAG
jgi:two-component system nitrate/nitrite response regulator NarL